MAIVVPIVAYGRALAAEGVDVSGEQKELSVTPQRAYGIYFDDADNSGYSESCSAEDGQGRSLDLKDPPWSIGTETETLDHVFESPTDRVSIECSVDGATASVRPLPSNRSLLLGLTLATTLGWLGVFMLVSASRQNVAVAFASTATARGEGEQSATTPPAFTPPPRSDRKIAPAVVATAVGLPLLGLHLIAWIWLVINAPSLFDDADLWDGAPPPERPGLGPSSWDMAQATWWPDLLPVGIGVVLILATWFLALRGFRAAAWATSAIACATAIFGGLL